ncbi:lipoyl protein ligase domain-containing protein [Aestuariibacter salexigens]|uniref:lipoyl protein ligase domain-containing protein n=1 Tax=Aestuariibacter salexigens TaxID=226010 RepID=UPI00040D2A16|nr:hypothetical protein [Aestuariibacter salexigens]
MEHKEEVVHIHGCGSALDENAALSEMLQDGNNQLRHLIWHYQGNHVVLGRSQKPTDAMQLRAQQYDVGVCQRLSGGGAVLASEGLVSVSTVIPTAHPMAHNDLIACFQLFGAIWQAALSDLGVPTRVCDKVDKGPEKHQWQCFAGASHGELFDTQNRKLVGLAQVRKRHAIAVMMGVYVQPVDWLSLHQIYLGYTEKQDVEWIKNRTSHLTAYASVQDLTGLMQRVDEYLIKHRMHI